MTTAAVATVIVVQVKPKTLCLCGNELAPVLVRLGSVWCHDCREDEQRRYEVLVALNRQEPRLAA